MNDSFLFLDIGSVAVLTKIFDVSVLISLLLFVWILDEDVERDCIPMDSIVEELLPLLLSWKRFDRPCFLGIFDGCLIISIFLLSSAISSLQASSCSIVSVWLL